MQANGSHESREAEELAKIKKERWCVVVEVPARLKTRRPIMVALSRWRTSVETVRTEANADNNLRAIGDNVPENIW
jgi:hypothetical protein